MLKSKKQALTMALLCAVASVGFVMGASAEETKNHDLAEVVVEGTQDVLPGGMAMEKTSIGLLGAKDVMEVPFTVTEITNKTISTFASPYSGISDSLSLIPSVRADRGGTYTDISIRGLYQSGHGYYVNGIPGMLAQENIPTAWVDSISVISGPNLGVNETPTSEAAGGSVNFTSKKASADGNAKVKVAYRGGSSTMESVDVGRRFGKDDKYGIRIVAENISGNTNIDGENLEKQTFGINLDQKSEKSETNLLIAYDHVDHKGGPGALSFSKDVTKLPSVPDTSRIYKPDWSYNEYDNWIVVLNHDQKLTKNLDWYVKSGYHREDWYGYVDGNPTVINNNGDFKITMTNYPLAVTQKHIGTGFKGEFEVGNIKNDYMVGIDKTWYYYDLSKNPNFATAGLWSGTGNLYQDNKWPSLPRPSYAAEHANDRQMTGWHIVDTMKFLDDKLQLTLGLHGHKATLAPENGTVQKSDATCPTYAVTYRVNDDVSIFADHTESFGFGSFVSTNNGYANAGQVLDPAKTKQNEFGVKFKVGNIVNTVSAFKITKQNTIDSYENGKKYLRVDGQQTNKGFDWSFTGEVADKWDMIGGIMYLDAKDYKGNDINGAANFSGTLGAVYHPDDNTSFIGRATYMGSSTINDGALDVPSYMKYDLGVSYKTKVSKTPVTFDAMCYNITGKEYWNARSGSSSLSLGAPRTFVLSATFDI